MAEDRAADALRTLMTAMGCSVAAGEGDPPIFYWCSTHDWEDGGDAEGVCVYAARLATALEPLLAAERAKALREVCERASAAADRVDLLASSYWEPTEKTHLWGKAEGVRLVCSYIEEDLRTYGAAASTGEGDRG